jgi:hypothetical protein
MIVGYGNSLPACFALRASVFQTGDTVDAEGLPVQEDAPAPS